jgi:hypothetical protein
MPDWWQATPVNARSGKTSFSDGVWYTGDPSSKTGVRQMPGDPASPFKNSQSPYYVQQRNDQTLDKYGNPVESDSPEAHIPADEFEFNPDFFIE